MSWQPKQNWQPEGRPGFRRGRAASEEGEEVEESGEMKSPENITKKKEDDDTEEEGEITPVPANPLQARSASTGHVDFQSQFRARGPGNARFGVRDVRDRPRQRNSFSGTSTPRMNANSTTSAPPFQRDGQPPPPPPPPPFRGEPPPYRESPNPRDIIEGQPPTPRGGRDYRDFGSTSAGSGQRSDGNAFGGRDFRNEHSSLNRDFGDGSPNFRGESKQPRDFRGEHIPPRDFRGNADPNREYRPDRDYRERDRNQAPAPHINRDFRSGNQPFGRGPSNSDKRDKFGNSSSIHREQSFGSRDNSFRDGQTHETPYRDGSNREGQFGDGREPHFRDNANRDTPFRDGPNLEAPFQAKQRERPGGRDQSNSRGSGIPFSSRGPLNRDTGLFDDLREDGVGQKPNQLPMPQIVASTSGTIKAQQPSFSPSAPKIVLGQGTSQILAQNNRPTDPRRRPSKDLGSPPGAFGGKIGQGATDVAGKAVTLDPRVPPVGSHAFNDGSSIPSAPHTARRMSSYSSLADSSSQATDGSAVGTNNPAHRSGGGIRSPAVRRSLNDAVTRNESGEYYGHKSGPPQGRHWSAINDRGRPGASTDGSSLSRLQIPKIPLGQQQHQPQLSPSQHQHQMGPATQSRLSNIRTNDPRFKQDNSSDFGRPNHELSSSNSQHRSDRMMVDNQLVSSGVDPFGRTRDWKDRPFSNRSGGSTPRSSPVKQKNIRAFPSNSQEEKSAPNLLVASSLTDKTKVTDASEASGPSRPRSKPDQVQPLSTSLLGDEGIIEKAQSAMKHLSDVISDPGLKANCDDLSLLPTKQVIMLAVKEIEKLTKEAQKECESLEDDQSKVLQEEENERKEEAVRLAEEEVQREIEKSRQAAEALLQEEKAKASALNRILEESQGVFLEAKNTLQKEFDDYVLEAMAKEKRQFLEQIEEQMVEAASNFDKDIIRAQRDLEKARSSSQRAESKFANAESEYKALLKTEDEEGPPKEGSVDSPSKLSALVNSIISNNKRNASEAQIFSSSLVSNSVEVVSDMEDRLQISTDPKYYRTNEEWSSTASRVSCLNDALFPEPSDCPYFQHGERKHSLLGASVKEYVRDKQRRLLDRWAELAEEYEVRKRLYERQQKKLAKKGQQRGSISNAGRKSIFGDKNSSEREGIDRSNVLESTGRSSNNPYRRARRGNEVRSEYEQEQIIAEIAAKEAMEKRITHGGSRVPRQICRLERDNTASYLQTFTAQRVDDPVFEERKEASTNIWSDMEKCIFLDRFLQFPKDFRRIASFLRNKTTKDCIAFYYDSKQAVPYKGALKEHMMRRKRKGDYQIWDASIQAAISVGAVVTAGSNEEKPVVFTLPSSDRTYATRTLHPLKREVLDAMRIERDLGKISKDDLYMEETKSKSRKRSRDPLFSLDKEHTKFLRVSSQESMNANRARLMLVEGSKGEGETLTMTPPRKAPQKWTMAEKRIFADTLEEHGRDWAMLSKALGTKSISQIKNFYYDYKKQSGKFRGGLEKKDSRGDQGAKNRTEDSSKKLERKSLSTTDGSELGTSHARNRGQQAGNEALLSDIDGVFKEKPQSVSPLLRFHEQMLEGIPETGNQELIQQLLSQQLQQKQMQFSQQTPSTLQQLLSQQQQQRERQQLGQLSLEDAHRLLQQQSQSRHQHVLSNLIPWLTASQLLQTQSRLQHAQAAAVLQQQETSQLSPSVSDMADVTSLQRLLQLQQASQNPYGLTQSSHNPLTSLLMSRTGINSSATSGLSAGLLSQLEQLSGPASSISSEATTENLSALAGSQRLLSSFGNNGQPAGTGATSLGGSNSLAQNPKSSGVSAQNIESSNVSDPLNMLARAIPRTGDANNQNFPDGQEGTDRHND